MSGTRAKSVIRMEKLIYGYLAIKITLGEAVVRGDLSAQKYVTDAFKVELDGRTNVKTETGRFQTSVPNVFTAGDMHRGQSLVVWAIREGREAAKAVDESLMSYSYLQ